MKTNSLQVIYDTVCTHLLSMKRRSYGHITPGRISCLYRGPESGRCAVGCLIPDSLYTRSMEGHSVVSLFRDYPSLRTHILGDVPDTEKHSATSLLSSLQCCHDFSDNWSDDDSGLNAKGHQALIAIAKRFSLIPYTAYSEGARSA